MNDVQVGSPEQWKAFAKRNKGFVGALEILLSAFDTIFDRQLDEEAELVDRIVFAAGHMAVDDFMEILLLCANAEAHGAEKVLRPMFERVVTMKYLRDHPESSPFLVETLRDS